MWCVGAEIFQPCIDNLFPSQVWTPPLLFFPSCSQLSLYSCHDWLQTHLLQVTNAKCFISKGRHPPSPLAQVKNWPARIAYRTRRTISIKRRPVGPKRWGQSWSSRGKTKRQKGPFSGSFHYGGISVCLLSFIAMNVGTAEAEAVRHLQQLHLGLDSKAIKQNIISWVLGMNKLGNSRYICTDWMF